MDEPEWNAGALRRDRGDENLLVRFELVPCQDEAESLKAGRPVFKDVTYIRIALPGHRLMQVHRPVREEDKGRFPRQWAHWEAAKQNMSEGTPLSQWPQVTRSQVEELAFMHVHSVEQLATLPDGAAQQMRGGQALKERAKDFLKAAKDSAHVGQMRAELERRDAEMAALRQQLASQAEVLAGLTAKADSEARRQRAPRPPLQGQLAPTTPQE